MNEKRGKGIYPITCLKGEGRGGGKSSRRNLYQTDEPSSCFPFSSCTFPTVPPHAAHLSVEKKEGRKREEIKNAWRKAGKRKTMRKET